MTSFELYNPLIAEIINGKVRPSETDAFRSKVDQHGRRGTCSQSGGGSSPSHRSSKDDGTSPPLPSVPTSQAEIDTSVSAQFERAAEEAKTKALAEVAAQKAADEAEEQATDDAGLGDASDGGNLHTSRDGWPAGSEAGSIAPDLHSSIIRTEIEAWDKANVMLYHVLLLRTKGVAASLVKKHKPRPGQKGNGVQVWRTLKDKFQPDDQQHRRELITDLNSITMKEGADPDTFVTDVWDLA